MSEPSTLERQLQALASAGLGRGGEEADGESLLRAALAQLQGAVGCPGGNVYLCDARHLVLVLAANERIPAAALSASQERRLPLDRSSPAGLAGLTRSPFHTPDVYTLSGEPGFDPTGDQRGFRTASLLALPVEDADGELLGVVELFTAQGGAGLVPADAGRVQPLLPLVRRALEAERLERGHLEAIYSLAANVEREDEEVGGHVRRIAGYSVALARALGCEPNLVRAIRLASPLHDLGKFAIPTEVLYKPGKLTEEEFAATKEHCVLGERLLAGLPGSVFELAARIAASHHERWDGRGYPRGLQGEEIPLAARIVAVADVFDALTTRRIYKPAMGVEQSLQIIRQESGSHFDPRLVEAFQGIFAEILDVKSRTSSG